MCRHIVITVMCVLFHRVHTKVEQTHVYGLCYAPVLMTVRCRSSNLPAEMIRRVQYYFTRGNKRKTPAAQWLMIQPAIQPDGRCILLN